MSDTGTGETRLSEKRPVIFGEVLFDTFPDGSAVLGGAPFNVAWHLQGFGAAPLFISRIGDDGRGKEVIKAMSEWGLDTAGLQTDTEHPTGLVRIELDNGQPTFSILPDQAYDFIDIDIVNKILQTISPALLYYGTLAARSPVSAGTLKQIKNRVTPSFVDINLRTPWWNAETVNDALATASWLKLNDDEIEELIKINNIDAKGLEQAAKSVIENYKPEFLIVTRGEHGAFIATKDEVLSCPPIKANSIVDTVGAGDAFSAVTLFGLLQQWPLVTILERALQFAAAVCGLRGATINDKNFYSHFLEEWSK